MKFKKLLSVILAIVLCLCSLTVGASAEEDEGLRYEDVEVSVVYRPLKSLFVIGVSSPVLEDTVIKVTYPDGTIEKVRVEKDENDFYFADKYRIYTSTFNDPQLISPGLNNGKIIVRYDSEDGVRYSGAYTDYTYLYIPSAEELFYAISSLIRIYSPFN